MAEDVTTFKAGEGVARANFNSRINQINTAIEGITPSYGTEGLTAGESELETGRLYLMYE